jgi:hypothetical protein
VVLRTCKVSVTDIQDVEHSVEVTAATLYEAVATALAALQQDTWVGEIGRGLTTVTVVVQQPPVGTSTEKSRKRSSPRRKICLPNRQRLQSPRFSPQNPLGKIPDCGECKLLP